VEAVIIITANHVENLIKVRTLWQENFQRLGELMTFRWADYVSFEGWGENFWHLILYFKKPVGWTLHLHWNGKIGFEYCTWSSRENSHNSCRKSRTPKTRFLGIMCIIEMFSSNKWVWCIIWFILNEVYFSLLKLICLSSTYSPLPLFAVCLRTVLDFIQDYWLKSA
jgi:hypothetical protein